MHEAQQEHHTDPALDTGTFILHPSAITLETVRDSSGEARGEAAFGGLAFDSTQAEEPGTVLWLRFPSVEPNCPLQARVAWCEPTASGYRIGVTFFDAQQAFRCRMIEQICAIEAYRRAASEATGDDVSHNQAAREWIRNTGSRFPNP